MGLATYLLSQNLQFNQLLMLKSKFFASSWRKQVHRKTQYRYTKLDKTNLGVMFMEKKDKNEKKEKYIFIDEKIKDRESWFKIIILSVIISVISWKILQASISINNFDFNELLALILAIFSISLSVIFYFKATETSNNFYDNSYQFTKEISEVLGRIEAGFGERLRHLDEGYSDLREKVHYSNISTEETEKEIDDEQKNLSKAERERNQLIEEIIERAEMQDQEKKQFIDRLKQKEEEIDELKGEIRVLRNNMYEFNEDIPLHILNDLRNEIIPKIGEDTIIEAPPSYINNSFKRLKEGLSKNLLTKLRYHGILDKKYNLTRKGLELLRYYAKINKRHVFKG